MLLYMQIVNGAGTRSRLKCINSECKGLPTGILKGKHKRGFEIQIQYCKSHEGEAKAVAIQQFGGIFFEGSFAPPWLKKAQENEIQILRESQLPSKRES